MESAFKKLYQTDLKKKLQTDLSLANINMVPRLQKIVINAGVKGVVSDSKLLNYVYDGILAISGQKPVKTRAKKSIAGFKIREGLQIGCTVTLRGASMYSFLEKLIKVVVPSIRDFRGLNAKFDKQGNYNLGLKDWTIFPEINYDRFPNPHGLNITMNISNSTGSGKGSFALLRGFGMPFIQSNK